jgi:hypothetical protein
MRRIFAYGVAGTATLVLVAGPSANGQPGWLRLTSSVARVHVTGGALGAWSAPELIPAHELGTPAPTHPPVFDAKGDAVLVWTEARASFKEALTVEYLVRASVRPVGGTWQPPELLSRFGLNPTVASDADGDAIAVWESPFGLQAAVRPAGGSWLATQTVATPGGEDPQVASNASGEALLVANRQAPGHSTGIQAVLRPSTGPFSPAQVISAPDNDFHPRIAMNAHGDALVAWERDDPCCSLEAAFHPARGGWSKPRVLAGRHGSPTDQQVAIDDRGDGVVVWRASRGRKQSVESASLSANGRWTARHLAEAPLITETVDVGMDARGDAMVVWCEVPLKSSAFGRGSAIWARIRPARRGWTTAQKIRGADGSPSLAVDARGNALVAWQDRGEIKVAARPIGSRWSKPYTVSAPEHPAWAADGGLAALDARGDALVTWQNREDGIKTAWHASLFP